MERSIHQVAELPDATRSAVENLVGHPLENDELIYVATLGVHPEPAPADRAAAWDELEAIISQGQQNAAQSGLPSELIDAECDAVRYDRRA